VTQVHPIPNDHCLAEGKPRFGAVPIHEFVDGVAIAPLRIRARQTVENRGLRDFKIGQPQDRLGDSSFGFASLYLFHDPWPPPPWVDHAPASQQVQSGWRVTRTERIGVTSQTAATIHCLMLFSGQNHFALEPFPRDSQVRPAINLAMG
jgi:hypothetical protein